jgi:hypothetical protein
LKLKPKISIFSESIRSLLPTNSFLRVHQEGCPSVQI